MLLFRGRGATLRINTLVGVLRETELAMAIESLLVQQLRKYPRRALQQAAKANGQSSGGRETTFSFTDEIPVLRCEHVEGSAVIPPHQAV